MNLTQIKHALRRLSLARLRELDGLLHELITKAEDDERARRASPRKQTVVGQTLGDKTYRLEGVRCGKENCKCARGKLHGPYWYSYTRLKDKVRSQYVGKSLPRAVQKKLSGRSRK